MASQRDQFFKEIYEIDPNNDAYMIEVALDSYADIFSEWDPAPFKRRDLDADLQIYLEAGAEDIPDRHGIELCFILPPGTRDMQAEKEFLTGLRNSFVFKTYQLRKEIKKDNHFILRYMVMGFALLWLGYTVPSRVSQGTISSIIADGIFVGGWVFLWEAVYLFFFTNRDLYMKHRTYRRLQRAPVIFREINIP
ncbi:MULTISPECIES: hypothetical protein [unclassified Synechocystis]|uniref:hypothetical protein n=1 Tax=unclassified Synechocystis TaxID=2640012 RepID=UPI0003FD5189|nr:MULTISPECIES: hypothetical protein [unclassified Synechocystis]AIE74550.1 hypothetical protein D082_20220 [Synechocystis sp. PCC 6714]MCT0254085.1 hypothetical protein [Synechocystis sp. CS-94]